MKTDPITVATEADRGTSPGSVYSSSYSQMPEMSIVNKKQK